MKMIIRKYSDLIKLKTFEERYEYLKIKDRVIQENRYINQLFYKSDEWLSVRNKVIERDNACDLGVDGREINDRVYIHHMNPITKDDIFEKSDFLLNPEYLICVTKTTHEAIHYGNVNLLIRDPIIRTPNDTCPWKKGGC